jgi:hypothetical protein
MGARKRSPGKIVLIAVGVVLLAGIIVQIVNQNVTNTASDWAKYGRLSVPGAAVFTLPGGSLDLILQDDIDNGLTIPKHITVSVTPQAGAQPAVITRDVGQSAARRRTPRCNWTSGTPPASARSRSGCGSSSPR